MKIKFLTTSAALAVGIWIISASLPANAEQLAPNPNYGTITITISDYNYDYFENFGTLDNRGVLATYGTLENYGTLDNYYVGNMHNVGTLDNNFGGTLTNSGYLANLGNMHNFGTLDNSGQLENYLKHYLLNSGTLTNSGGLLNSGNLTNSGALTNSGGLTNNSSSTLTNSESGTLTNSGHLATYGTLVNDGTLTNSGTLTNEKNEYSIQGGIIEGGGNYTQIAGNTINNGTMVQQAIQITGGQLSGTGTITGNVTIGAGATVNPGEDGGGTLTINGDFTSSGNLIFEIYQDNWFEEYNQLVIDNGTALFTGGSMEFNFIDDSQAEAGDRWDLLYATSIDGLDTLTYTINGLDSGLGYKFVYMNGVGSLLITANPVPVPGAALLLGSGLLGLAGLGRRRKAAVA